jgi:hypothetical protein
VKLDLRTRLSMLETELMLPAYEAPTVRPRADEALRGLLRVVGADSVRAWASDEVMVGRRRSASPQGRRPPAAAAAAREPVFS